MPTLHDDMTFTACMTECKKTRDEAYHQSRRAIHNRNCEFHYAKDCAVLSFEYGKRAALQELASRKLNASADMWMNKAFDLLTRAVKIIDDEVVVVTDIKPPKLAWLKGGFAQALGRTKRGDAR